VKKGYTKVFIIEIILITLLLFNSFVKNIFSDYLLVLFLFLSLCLFKIFFDFEKDKHRNTKDIIIYISIYLLVVLIIFYALGLFTGYARIPNYYTFDGLFNFIIPITLTIIISEFLRYQLLRKSEGNFKLIILTTILFILVDISNAIYYGNFSTAYYVMVFIGLTLIPSVGKNIFSTYTSSKTGYKPVIFFNIFIGLYRYLLPIKPDFNEYLQSIISLYVLVLITVILLRILKDESIVELETESTTTKRMGIFIFILETLVAFILVYFVSGYFRYYAIAIASDSMRPEFDRGSVAIIRKIDPDEYSDLKVGDIVAYNREDIIVAHRIAKIVEVDDKRYFYTKGDANKNIDNYVVGQEMILGTINTYIPFLGYPTVLLNELLTD